MNQEPPWAYIVIYSGEISRDDFVRSLDEIPEILNWYTCLPNTVFVVANLPAARVVDLIRAKVKLRHILVLDAETDRNGWLPTKAWEFLRNPKASS